VQRIATRDVEIRGTLIRAGESVTFWNVSAKRDEAQFRHANEFDIARHPNRHLTFGSGIHRCIIGASVGQVELAAVFRRLVEKQIRLAVAGPIARLRSNFILGITSLSVRVVS
jgi:cytochrome P450